MLSLNIKFTKKNHLIKK